ncbi:ParB/RepB/Spo0J family partition protein [Desulfonatronovibrio hydrogenovorans]|uniref:ParB/RepB/Spo0J family partition protein n=1 Tax=Desulfonatronovibrio hydrogenovorans TaxID=53245 RepID=UPI0005500D52|nr:ParB/RepB/Spo0J family partition protein [Desulfonatronovibrio hydrogenovorans]
MKINNKGLGKGLDALIKPDFYEEKDQKSEVTNLSINKIHPNPHQPRTIFNDDGLKDLSESIKKQGVLQPILVRKNDQGEYQIIAGERRWRASIDAGLKTIPALIRDYNDAETLAIALIENLQREDLNIMEQARALDRLKNELAIKQEELAEKIGKSRSQLANILRLMNLPEKIQDMLQDEQLSAGHARALLGLKDKQDMLRAAAKVAQKNLSVRATENLVRQMGSEKNKADQRLAPNKVLTEKVERIIQTGLDTRVKVKIRGSMEKGELVIKYTDNNQLDKVLKAFSQNQLQDQDL